MDDKNSSKATTRPIDHSLGFNGADKGIGIKGSVADRDWPYEPDDPDNADDKNKPHMEFNNGDAKKAR